MLLTREIRLGTCCLISELIDCLEEELSLSIRFHSSSMLAEWDLCVKLKLL